MRRRWKTRGVLKVELELKLLCERRTDLWICRPICDQVDKPKTVIPKDSQIARARGKTPLFFNDIKGWTINMPQKFVTNSVTYVTKTVTPGIIHCNFPWDCNTKSGTCFPRGAG